MLCIHGTHANGTQINHSIQKDGHLTELMDGIQTTVYCQSRDSGQFEILPNLPFLFFRSLSRRAVLKEVTQSLLTVKLLIRLAGLILFSKQKMRVLLEIAHFSLLNLKDIAGLIRIRVLLEGEPY